MSCDKGHEGLCCCECKHFLTLTKHPWNLEPYKGSISEKSGLYTCTVMNYTDKTYTGMIFDRKHGSCELWEERN